MSCEELMISAIVSIFYKRNKPRVNLDNGHEPHGYKVKSRLALKNHKELTARYTITLKRQQEKFRQNSTSFHRTAHRNKGTSKRTRVFHWKIPASHTATSCKKKKKTALRAPQNGNAPKKPATLAPSQLENLRNHKFVSRCASELNRSEVETARRPRAYKIACYLRSEREEKKKYSNKVRPERTFRQCHTALCHEPTSASYVQRQRRSINSATATADGVVSKGEPKAAERNTPRAHGLLLGQKTRDRAVEATYSTRKRDSSPQKLGLWYCQKQALQATN